MAFECDIRGLTYKFRQGLSRHKKSEHAPIVNDNQPASPINPAYQCSACHVSYANRKKFNLHLQVDHDIDVSTDTLIFSSAAEVAKWKTQFEAEDQNRYITSFGNGNLQSLTPNNKKPIYYVCHRSGRWKSEGKGQRHLKTQGSKKINGYCPAQIKVTSLEDGKLQVLVTRTHWGHFGDELAHSSLTSNEKVTIAAKIASKIPYSEILNEIRDDAKKQDELKRLHLTTRKELCNIEGSFNLSSEAVRHKSDTMSVDSWVCSMKDTSEEHCILFYKPQGANSDEFPFLKNDDFVLGIMNDLQASMLEHYGKDAICIDGTHGLNPYDFQLITLIVLDDMRQGFPCAFFFTNRTDKDALKIMYKKIKDRLGILQPKIFMSDMEESFFNAWVEVFSPPASRLWCTWHVERAWRKNLTKIKNVTKKKTVYKMIKSLMEESDIDAFQRAENAAVKKMQEDPETQDFGEYFQSHYANNSKSWAFCYRIHAGLNTNMHLENLHRCLKHNYLLGVRVKRLDKAIYALMQFLRDKAFDRIIFLHKGKVTKKLQELRKRHKSSLVMSTEIIQDGLTWKVPSSNGQEIYNITLEKERCDCQLLCTDCSACIHKYACSCLDSSIKYNMCKHIHLVCRLQQQILNSDATGSEAATGHDENNEHTLVIVSSDDARAKEKDALMNNICRGGAAWSNGDTRTVTAKKEKIISLLTTLTEEVKHKINSSEELEALEKILLPIQPTLLAVRTNQVLQMPLKEVNPSTKRKIDHQPRFFSTKKQRKKVDPQLEKPLPEEKNAIIFDLIHSTSTYP